MQQARAVWRALSFAYKEFLMANWTPVALTWRDRSDETSTMTFQLPSVASDGSNYAAVNAAAATVITALNAVTEGTLYQHRITTKIQKYTNAIPTTGRREFKVLVRYQDDVTLNVFSFEIPCVDETKFPWLTGSDFVDINDVTITEFTDLLAALNTQVISPDGGAITVISMEGVGRNN